MRASTTIVATLAVIGGVAAGGGDIIGQAATAALQGKPLDINWGSTAGAVAGGALAGAGGAALAPALPETPAATAVITAITSGPGVFLPSIGQNLYDYFRKLRCHQY